jgi:2-(1,2-epoxy-1,2-dihydrophenyl)acetyl-CoA isomerase
VDVCLLFIKINVLTIIERKIIKHIGMETVLFEVQDGVGFITLNRPEKLNCFNREMALQLQEILDECEKSLEVRCVYLTGKGKGFSAGQDLAEITDLSRAGIQTVLLEQFHPILIKIRNLQKPVVAAVNGVAAGAGANIALCCDIVVAANSAIFLQIFSKIGLIPDCGGTFFLPRLIGFQKASAFMMLGEKLSAKQAERSAVIYKAIPNGVFEAESKKIAYTLAKMPTQGLWFTKKALNESLNNSLEQQLQLEDYLQQRAAATNDFKEGVDAFLHKRKPEFSGN